VASFSKRQQLLPEIDQPKIESGGCEDDSDRREAPDTPPESQQHLHVLDSPPLEHPQRADQVGTHCDQRCRNFDEVQGRQWPDAHRQDRAGKEHGEQYRQFAELIDFVVESLRLPLFGGMVVLQLHIHDRLHFWVCGKVRYAGHSSVSTFTSTRP